MFPKAIYANKMWNQMELWIRFNFTLYSHLKAHVIKKTIPMMIRVI